MLTHLHGYSNNTTHLLNMLLSSLKADELQFIRREGRRIPRTQYNLAKGHISVEELNRLLELVNDLSHANMPPQKEATMGDILKHIEDRPAPAPQVESIFKHITGTTVKERREITGESLSQAHQALRKEACLENINFMKHTAEISPQLIQVLQFLLTNRD